MIQKFHAVLLKRIKYGDNSLIINTYTREKGSASFFLRSVKSKSKGNISLSPLCHLEIVASSGFGSLMNVKEMKLLSVHQNILSDVNKSSITMFINEVLQQTIHDHDKDESLFEFLTEAMAELEQYNGRVADFHLKMMVFLTKFLGIYPNSQQVNGDVFFDLFEGVFCSARPFHGRVIEPQLTGKFTEMLNQQSWKNELQLSKEDRNVLLNALIDYYKIHIAQFGNLKSREVLETVFN